MHKKGMETYYSEGFKEAVKWLELATLE